MEQYEGRIHSIETSGMVDGPGIRFVVFMQGCLLRCQYCHNPDTWTIGKGQLVTVQELVEEIRGYLPFLQFSGGGVTVSGGEPLLQADFLLTLFRALKRELGVHTAIDSSGGCFSRRGHFFETLHLLMQHTDLVLLDLKQIDPQKHLDLTGKPNDHILDFARFLSETNIPVWIRHVLVPGLTDDEADLRKLADFIKTLRNVERVEVLPYHEMGKYKYEQLGMKYPLAHIKPPDEETIRMAREILGAH
ncbi:Pyruvate formate-lyase-activating enzyme [Paenibacillus auburnensis]|jgi:pyruvate formate lyase activating enzyme|uniref:Pyruvate formate-lyase-activating enzyme n=1 Tax=Paenibacillus auburnensis TaxID=2905649 RepID=A0ABN8H0S1_9BACL|nr:pyruvate formate-lyase-activating protein [Paenibacillus auburnensis]CAH1219038.1 Pyruvate formate-lyase-activating enzyme [Paenibacillus auburnensis]